MKKRNVPYQGLSLPKRLLDKIDEAIQNEAYTNKTDFIKCAIREKLEKEKTK